MTTLSNSERKRLLRAKAAVTAANADRQTAFRRAEKRFMSRVPEPDYSDVLDLRQDDLQHDYPHVSVCQLLTDLYDLPLFGESRNADCTCARAYRLHKHSGAIIIPDALSPAAQRRVIRHCLRDYAKSPNDTNLDAHYLLPEDGLWHAHERGSKELIPVRHCGNDENSTGAMTHTRSLVNNEPASETSLMTERPPPAASSTVVAECASSLLYKLRWSNIGLLYHWSTKSYHFERLKAGDVIPVPDDFAAISMAVLAALPTSVLIKPDFRPEAGIINYYQMRSTLMGHIDHSELVDDAPLVSVSLGHAAVFLLGGASRDEEPLPIMLRSGDVLIMSGACRRAYHGVPRIVEGSLPQYLERDPEDEDWDQFAAYMATSRININVRQVFPEGFQASTV
ncbi:hypothetical protein PYCC9005_000467 [Savitreella phatthalungensis]